MDISELIPKFGPVVGTAFCLILVSVGLITYDINTKTKQIEILKGKLSSNEIAKIKTILNSFDRKAVHDQMHEEHLTFMVKSLNDLNVNIKKLGISTIAVPEIKDLFLLITQDLEEIVHISLLINDTANGSNNFLDLRSLGMLEELKPYYNDYKIKKYIQSNFDEMNDFINSRLHKKNDNINLSKEITFIYFFGKIDQLKRDIVKKLDLIESLLDS